MAPTTPRPTWRAALRAALRTNGAKAHAKYAQLATVDARTGAPAVRTVVFRGFGDETYDARDVDDARRDALAVCADARSRKIEDVARDARGELAWYFTETREQFRVTGTLTTATATRGDDADARARANLWRKMRRSARGQFLWPAPGDARSEEGAGDAGTRDVDETDARLDDDAVGEHFALVTLRATRVDHLSLRKNERTVYERAVDGAWTARRVNP